MTSATSTGATACVWVAVGLVQRGHLAVGGLLLAFIVLPIIAITTSSVASLDAAAEMAAIWDDTAEPAGGGDHRRDLATLFGVPLAYILAGVPLAGA